MTTARIIEMVAGKGRTPVGKNADKFSPRYIRLHVSFGEIGQPETLERALEENAGAVEHKLSLDTDVEVSAILLELPSVQAAAVRR